LACITGIVGQCPTTGKHITRAHHKDFRTGLFYNCINAKIVSEDPVSREEPPHLADLRKNSAKQASEIRTSEEAQPISPPPANLNTWRPGQGSSAMTGPKSDAGS
jgi:hypothetical protein